MGQRVDVQEADPPIGGAGRGGGTSPCGPSARRFTGVILLSWWRHGRAGHYALGGFAIASVIQV